MVLDQSGNRCIVRRERGPRVAAVAHSMRVSARQVGGTVQQAGAAILRWVAELPCDSREPLRSKEHELAVLGMRWTSDRDADAALAHEIVVAREQRRGVASDRARAIVAAAGSAATRHAARGYRRTSAPRSGLDRAGMAGPV
jgi:hypothetical protein